MPYAKDFPYEYKRCFQGVDHVGLRLFTSNRNTDLIKDESAKLNAAIADLRRVGVKARKVKGVYGSRRYANALWGWMVFVPDIEYTAEQQAVIRRIEG